MSLDVTPGMHESTIGDEQEQKRIKKRVQNRLSQRCIREKQLVKIQQLERRLNLLQAQNQSRSTEEVEALNTQLLRENEELRDTLQVMRKKLLSIGSMATSAADNIVCKTAAQLPTPSESPGTFPEQDGAGYRSSMSEIHAQGGKAAPSGASNILEAPHQSSIHDSTTNPWDTELFNTLELKDIQWEHWLMGNINPSSNTLMIELENLVNEISSKMTLGNLHSLLLAKSPRLVKAHLIEDPAEHIDDGTLNDLVRLAVRLIVNLSPSGTYIQIMDSIKNVEAILRWRLNPTPSNTAMLPPHLQPTEIQKQTPDRHPYLDFVPWASLRDQLILSQHQYDIPTLMIDLLHNTVRDVQDCYASFPVLDFQARLKYPSAPRNATLAELLELPVQNIATQDSKQRMLLVCETQKYGLDRVEDWRLLPAFFCKYSGLSAPSLVSELPVIDFNTAQLYFERSSWEGSTSASLQSNADYLRMMVK